ncbi:MAG: 2-hydroxyacid dehydrogenase [Azospirillaceae bacterium]|nr:2-hydroxyacid dehydrogenase [Azospirillaceae bacterium]
MKAIVFDSRDYDRIALERANAAFGHPLTFLDSRLDPTTAALAQGFPAVIPFVNDQLDVVTLTSLAAGGTRLIAMRCTGVNNLDLAAAHRLGLRVVHVPTYSPHSVADYVFALLLSLVRRIPQAYNRVRDSNFSVEGLIGFDLYGKTFGLIGAGRIGREVARIAHGFGCRIIAYDPFPPPVAPDSPPIAFLPLDTVIAQSDILSLHAPLTPENIHLINAARLAAMKPGVILINTSRGGLIDTHALIAALKDRQIGGVGLDVYEREASVFYNDLSDEILADDTLARLLTFRNVLVTSHMGFLTREALSDIARVTLANLTAFEHDQPLTYELAPAPAAAPAP